ncbi:N-acetyltransferase [Xanthomonas arboricola pv. juglandis]|uniref:N-acetyltransferase n=1 Tax=Xanthomonas euroxanthea TaxID=2259622 RepID=A0AA46HAY2_9XANT|nr:MULTISPECIES: GNAT family N-acetyltransferase [Xanthomonas]SYZ50330.1 N-acetyltransferase [Xanthomonas arboricola pv. juglandis]CAD1794303.1 GNAT family N-acetyltransferase [Xanthomonas sp. CPBF 426]CAE1137989.1 GNAT family N-acetyltransferase [Xanthomonas euroxanthea]CAG2093291.1 GNAT family N-acetyltransferase [Xanthomonas euroxanthea]SUZ28616.1 N-acetyltransferase [Xanthomonas euroxanthea]
MSPLHVSTDPSALDIALIHRYLAQHTSWARDIPLAVVQRSIANSLCFGGFWEGRQVAFARVVSDYATVAYLGDVFVLPEHRGKGYSKQLMDAVMAHPDLQGLRRFSLATSDAHGLYARYGFTPPLSPQSLMERYFPGLYTR